MKHLILKHKITFDAINNNITIKKKKKNENLVRLARPLFWNINQNYINHNPSQRYFSRDRRGVPSALTPNNRGSRGNPSRYFYDPGIPEKVY